MTATLGTMAIYSPEEDPTIHWREGTWDEGIWKEVFGDVYGIHDFKGKTVVDIGGHIGSFSRLAVDNGAKEVHSFEAHIENYAVLRLNSESFENWKPHNMAVWKSDYTPELLWFRACSVRENTGGGCVYEDFPDGAPVEPIGLDTIIDAVGQIDILKLDCEGSEYQILMTSKKLDQVKVIAGEYHEVRKQKTELNSVAESHDMATLEAFLNDQGFAVMVTKKDENLGFFKAVRL